MKSAVLEKPVASGPLDADRVRALLLSRIACAADGLSRSALTAELAACTAHRMPLVHWRLLVEREIEALCEAGLTRTVGTRLEASDAGITRAGIFLGLKSALPRCWEEVLDVHLMAKALGLERHSGRRRAALATPDGLRAAIVERAFGLKIRGLATPSRLRAALARSRSSAPSATRSSPAYPASSDFRPRPVACSPGSSPRNRATSAPMPA